MNLKYIIIPLTVLTLSSCESTNNSEIEDTTTSKSTTIKGSSMLSSGASEQSKATICLDENANDICEKDEPKTYTDKNGKFELKVNFEVKDGTHLIAKDGYSLVRNNSNTDKLVYVKYYKSDEKEQHINALSTYVVNALKDNPSSTYKDVVDTFLNSRDLETNMINYDPIYAKETLDTSGNKYFNTTFALDKIMFKKAKEKFLNIDSNISLKSSSYRGTTTNPSNSEIDQTIEDNKDYLDSFLDILNQYLDDLSSYLDDWYNSIFSEDVNNTVEIVDVDIKRETFNGIWLLKNYNDAKTKTCTVIDNADNVAIYEKDGSVTELTLEYNDADKSLVLSKGFITAETIYFTEYKSNGTFKAYYSDKVTVNGSVEGSLDSCKSKL